MLNVVCVLKSGGDFTGEYVDKLESMLKRHLTVPFLFVPMTDERRCGKPGLLVKGWPGWWSKIETFRIEGPCLYFDLDTVIVGNIDELAHGILSNPDESFYMLRKFRQAAGMNSGIMAWTGDWKWLHDEFKIDSCPKYHRGDQEYIYFKLMQKEVKVRTIQEHLPGIVSYKRHCRGGLPDGARVVCFHGQPRPTEVKAAWMQEHWR